MVGCFRAFVEALLALSGHVRGVTHAKMVLLLAEDSPTLGHAPLDEVSLVKRNDAAALSERHATADNRVCSPSPSPDSMKRKHDTEIADAGVQQANIGEETDKADDVEDASEKKAKRRACEKWTVQDSALLTTLVLIHQPDTSQGGGPKQHDGAERWKRIVSDFDRLGPSCPGVSHRPNLRRAIRYACREKNVLGTEVKSTSETAEVLAVLDVVDLLGHIEPEPPATPLTMAELLEKRQRASRKRPTTDARAPARGGDAGAADTQHMSPMPPLLEKSDSDELEYAHEDEATDYEATATAMLDDADTTDVDLASFPPAAEDEPALDEASALESDA